MSATSRALINGRVVNLPRSTTEADIRRLSGIDPFRNLIRRTREGNFLVAKGSRVEVLDGDAFLDAPARVKGTEL